MEQQSKVEQKRQKTGGRRKGQLNKATATVREVIAHMAEYNAPKLNRWLTRVAEEDPAKAIDCYAKLIEYHIPKQRQIDLVTTHIDVAAILDRARGRIIDATSSQLEAPTVAQIEQSTGNVDYVKQELAWKQQQAERVQAELDAPYNPLELDGASEDDQG